MKPDLPRSHQLSAQLGLPAAAGLPCQRAARGAGRGAREVLLTVISTSQTETCSPSIYKSQSARRYQLSLPKASLV